MNCYFQRNTILEFEKAGPFRIVEIIGIGASSVVYRAINTDDHTEHLLKEFHPLTLPLSRDSAGNLILRGGQREKQYFDFQLEQFKRGYNRQIEFRKDPILKNRTSNVQAIHSGYGTLFIDMTVFSGVSYEKVHERSLSELIKRIRAITEVVSRYHALGYLHLDIKPENIFTLTDNCESVMFFDFDTVIAKSELNPGIILGKTEKYAAPELISPDAFRLIGEWTDIYAIGMIFFQKLFERFPDSHEQESGSSYDFRLTSGILNDVDKNICQLLTDFFRHSICKNKKFRWQSTDEMLRFLNQILAALQPSPKPPRDNEDIKNVGKQISMLSKIILISAILICLSVSFFALRKSDYSSEKEMQSPPFNTVQQDDISQLQFNPTVPIATEYILQVEQQTDPTSIPPTEIISEEDRIHVPTTPQTQQRIGNYVIETIANNLNGFRSMIVTNSGNVYYLNGSILHSTYTSETLDLQTQFDSPLENGYLAYDPYQNTVYLLAGGPLSIHDVTNLQNPVLVLENDSLTLNLDTGMTPDIAVLPDHSLVIPCNDDGSYRIILSSNTYARFPHIYNLSSPYYSAVTSDNIFTFRQGEVDASFTALSGFEEKSITLNFAAPYNEAVASSGSKLWFYCDGIGVCTYEADGSVTVHISQQDISITDYYSLDNNNIWFVAANESGEMAFYDNSLSSIRFIHSQ